MLYCLFLVALWSSAGKGLISWLSSLLCFVTFPSTLELGEGVRRETGLSPQAKYFTDRSKAVLLLWIFYVFCVLRLLCLCARLFICALWPPAGKGLTSWLSFVVSNREFVTFPLVNWVRCGTCLYRFLIFAPLLTSGVSICDYVF